MKKIVIQIFLAGIWMWLQPVFAEPVQGLYQASINVPNQDKSTYNQAVKEALQQVLVKVSGQSAVLDATPIQQSILHADQYVTTFSYQAVPTQTALGQSAHAPVTTAAAEPANLWQLQVQFDPQSVNKLLTDAHQPIFAKDRPQVMIWLAEQEADGRHIVGSGSDSPLVDDVAHIGEQRGIELLLPILDITDLNQITVEDVWAPYPAVINMATHRYGANAVLMGRVYQNPNQPNTWVGDWHFELGQTQQEWTSSADNEQALIASAINHMVDRLASQYVSLAKSQDDSQLQVSVYGVDNVAEYSKVTHYLKGISLVNQLKVVTIGTDHVTFDIILKGNKAQLLQTFSVDHLLQPDTAQQQNQQTLAYRLVS